jgi:hypothetical protein
MAINNNLSEALINVFYSYIDQDYPLDNIPDMNYSVNNVFNLFLRVDISGSEIIRPLLLDGVIDNILLHNYNNDTIRKDISILLYNNSVPLLLRTANAMLKAFVYKLNRGDRLIKVHNGKGEYYYGGRGIILDKDYNILFLSALHGVINTDKSVIYDKAMIYIHPKVFTSTGILEKAIVKYVVPIFATRGAPVVRFSRSNVIKHNIPNNLHNTPLAEIVIKDMNDKFLVRPKSPSLSVSDDDLNNLLLDNLEDIIISAGI